MFIFSHRLHGFAQMIAHRSIEIVYSRGLSRSSRFPERKSADERKQENRRFLKLMCTSYAQNF